MVKNMRNKYIIVTIKSWNIKRAKKFINNYSKDRIILMTHKEDLVYRNINKFNPRYVFFPHWSWPIPRDIYTNFECVGFHMTDLPFGRGGSPLQNLVVRGAVKTKISAIKIVKKLDAGPMYFKRNLLLHGSAEDIYKRASRIIFDDMIPYIMENRLIPSPQRGKTVMFKRRKPEESKIPDSIDLNGIYDYIRMLDSEGYPPAFIETENLRFEFTKALKKENCINVDVNIKKKG